MTSPYGATVLEHFRRPRNHRSLERPTVAAESYNPLCGDRVRVELEVAGGTISAAAFTANACAICTASASLLTERVRGLSTAAASDIGDDEPVTALGGAIPPARIACAVLPWRALRDAIRELPAA
jgi:nitrogen fixation protein NifU and related proteins